MRRTLFSLLTAGILLTCTSAQAQQPTHERAGINLSLWKRVSTQPNDSVGSTLLNIGIYSSMNRLNGVGVNLLGGAVRNSMNGIQMGGLFNVVGGTARGVQVAGITNVNGEGTQGVSISGLVGISGEDTRGVMMTGLVGVSGKRTQGIMASGLLNITGENSEGAFIGGIANICGENSNGLMLSGLLNVNGEDMRGVQAAGLLNIAGHDMTGLQLGGLLNVTERLNGMQVGTANIAIRARGVQLGILNYYHEELQGVQLGLINANRNTSVQTMVIGGSSTLAQVAARFKNRTNYTIVGIGTYNPDFGSKMTASFIYRAGLYLPLTDRFSLSGDLGFQHTETLSNHDHGHPKQIYSLQTRLNLEHQINDRLGAFVTGGYGWNRLYGHCSPVGHNFFFEAGLTVECGRLFPDK